MVNLVLVAFALLAWPRAVDRLGGTGPVGSASTMGASTPRRGVADRLAGPRATVGGRAPVLVAAVAGLAGLWAGPVVAAAAAIAFGTLARLVVAESGRQRRHREVCALLAAIRTLAREVRAGAPPLAAINSAAAAHPGDGARALARLRSALAVEGGTSEKPLHHQELLLITSARRGSPGTEVADRLAGGWALSATYGVPWAGLIDALVGDLADRVRAQSQRAAQVAGPKVSGYVLAAMPVLGLVLGIGMGADPVRILLGTGVGRLLLLVGSVLTSLGLLWSARIVGR